MWEGRRAYPKFCQSPFNQLILSLIPKSTLQLVYPPLSFVYVSWLLAMKGDTYSRNLFPPHCWVRCADLYPLASIGSGCCREVRREEAVKPLPCSQEKRRREEE